MAPFCISIALCTYNGEKYLKDQLASIACQTRLPDELIVCDDCSHDNTVNIVKNFIACASFPVHLYSNEVNIGSTKNFEKCISLCKGDLIFLSDQDDVWHPEKLRRIESIFLNDPSIGLAFSNALVVDKNLKAIGTVWQNIKFNKNEQNAVNGGNPASVLLRHNVVTGATMAFRASYKKEILPIPSSWVHDYWIVVNIAAFANIFAVKEPLIKYRQHSGQQIGVQKEGWLKTLKKYTLDLLINNKIYDRGYIFRLIEFYYLIYDRLINYNIKDYELLYQIKNRLDHFKVRASLPKQKVRRIPVIANELLTLRYYKYSMGVSSAVRDLLF